jgi:large subunit ribosomal protein L15
VTPDSLFEARILRKKKTRVKILGDGELTKKLNVTAHAFSKSARKKIEAAGGTVTVIDAPKEDKAPKAEATETAE